MKHQITEAMMALAFEIVEKTDEHGRYVEFKMTNKKEFVIKMDIFDFDRIKYNTCYYVHRHVTGGHNLPYVRRAVAIDGKNFTVQIHRELMLEDPMDLEKYVVFHDGDSLNIRRHNMEVRLKKDIHIANKNSNWKDNLEKYGVRSISVAHLVERGIYQAYYKNNYIGRAKTRELLDQKIYEYILQRQLKDNDERI